MRWAPKPAHKSLYRKKVTATWKTIGRCHQDFPHQMCFPTNTHIETPIFSPLHDLTPQGMLAQGLFLAFWYMFCKFWSKVVT